MSKRILVDALHEEEIRLVITENGVIEEFEYQNKIRTNNKSNIYLAKVTRVEPSLQAAFVDYGNERQGFLPFIEVHPDYYQIPEADKAELLNGLEIKKVISDELSDEGKPNIDVKVKIESKVIPHEKYSIQEVIKKDQVILVQLDKEERGNKGAALTTYISLAGRYCVLMPNSTKAGGISKRIQSEQERNRLKTILDEFYDKSNGGGSVIVRTAGEGHSKVDIERDLNYLSKLWDNIMKHTLSSDAPTFIHEEGDVLRKTIRDLYSSDIQEILISGETAYNVACEFMTTLLPKHANKIKQYTEELPIFTKHMVEEQLATLYNSKALLKSGGYIVINHTEALIAIDVNSGKSTSEKDIEDTALRNNLEAAYEIARQIKLRDIAGLIVIDFIDMYDNKNKIRVASALKDALSKDRARTLVGSVSNLGLLEMSRQRLNSNFVESNTLVCTHCDGKGSIRPKESVAITILRAIANEINEINEINDNNFEELRVSASHANILYMLNEKRVDIMNLEKIAKGKILLYIDEEAGPNGFYIEPIDVKLKQQKKQKALSNINIDSYIEDDNAVDESRKRNWSKGNVVEVKKSQNKKYRKKFTNDKGKVNKNVRTIAPKQSSKKPDDSLLVKMWNKIVN